MKSANSQFNNIRYKSIGALPNAYSPHIIGFKCLHDLLIWYLKKKKPVGSVSEEYLRTGISEAYFNAIPILAMHKERIPLPKFETIFSEFEKQKNSNKNSIRRNGDPYFDFGDGNIKTSPQKRKSIERTKTESFIAENKDLKYFVICKTELIEIACND